MDTMWDALLEKDEKVSQLDGEVAQLHHEMRRLNRQLAMQNAELSTREKQWKQDENKWQTTVQTMQESATWNKAHAELLEFSARWSNRNSQEGNNAHRRGT